MSELAKSSQEVLAAQLPKIRARLDLSAQGLAERVADLGGTLDRAAISKIENGKRGVSLDEALLLAAALGVAPIHLILPREDSAKVAIAELSLAVAAARAWWRGEEPLPGQDEKTFRVEVPASEWTRKPSHAYDEAMSRWASASRRVRVAEMAVEILIERQQKTPSTAISIDGISERSRLEARLDDAYASLAEAKVDEQDAEAALRAEQRQQRLAEANQIVHSGQSLAEACRDPEGEDSGPRSSGRSAA